MKPLSQRIFGIDPGSHAVGFAMIEAYGPLPQSPARFKVRELGVLRANRNGDFLTRISGLHEGLSGLVESCQPTICVMEKAFLGLNVQSAIRLGEARGALLSAVSRHQLKTIQVSPAAVKRAITGNGRATKSQVSLALEALMGIDSRGLRHDATDALAIALAYGLGTKC